MNAEFQRIARRDKKAFLNDQCKEIEENNRMKKTRHLFKKITGQKWYGPQKQKILRRGSKNIQKNYTKEGYDPDNHDSVMTPLEPDILECKVK